MSGRVKKASKSRRVSGRRADIKDKLDPANMGALDYKRAKLIELREDIQRCRDDYKFTALSQLHRLECQMHDEITMAMDGQTDPISAMTSADLVTFIASTLIDLPPVLQDELVGVFADIRSGRVVRLDPPRTSAAKAAKKKPAKKAGKPRAKKASG